jgi:hypothetical protein
VVNLFPDQTHRTRLEAILLAAAFALAHTQSPLYYSNQNQYLLHGLAAGGYGHLKDDWLANTRDPTPLFSRLVELGYRTLGEWSFQAAHFLLLMGYFLSVCWLVRALPGVPDTRSFRLAWAALFTAAHAAILRVASVELIGVDYPWYFQAGLASQYVLGPGLQPSAFGVLLITGLAAFAHGRPVLASGLFAGSTLFHSTYLLPAGLFTLAAVIALAVDGRRRTAVIAGAVALAVVSPVLAYIVTDFGPTTPKMFGAAQHLLAEVRIPHHAVVSRWFDAVAVAQLAWIVLGIGLIRRTRLFPLLAVPVVGGLVLTLLQLTTANDTLALLFPWRVSVVLVPVATAVVAAKLVVLPLPAGGRGQEGGRWVVWVAVGVLLTLAVGGVVVMAAELGYRTADEDALYSFVRENAKPGDVYLLPVSFPAVGTGRGAVSNTFTPPARPKLGTNQIPVDLLRFRLHTGTAIHVDFKSVPYADAEVLEWYRRMQQVQDWYANPNWDTPEMRESLRREGITHVVAPRGKELRTGYLEWIHTDPMYVVYRVH